MSLGKRLIETAGQPPITNFNIVTYTGTGSSQAITGVGFRPDKVVIKRRNASDDWAVLDSNRGANVSSWNNNSAQSSFTFSFDTDGFTVPSTSGMTNASGSSYVAYCWKANEGTTSSNTDGTITSTVQANTGAGFSIVTYTGDGANGTVGHGLGATPEIVIVKRLNSTGNWSISGNVGGLSYGTNKLMFNSTNGLTNDTNEVTSAGSSTFTAGTSGSVGASGSSYVAYCFRSITGVSKFGSYTSNATTKINTGFQPDFFIFKYLDTGDWYVQDKTQSESVTGIHGGDLIKKYYVPNSNAAENSVSTGGVEIMSDGFYPTNWFDTTNGVFYMAFKIT